MDTRASEGTKRSRETTTDSGMQAFHDPMDAVAKVLHLLSSCLKPELVASVDSLANPRPAPLPSAPNWTSHMND